MSLLSVLLTALLDRPSDESLRLQLRSELELSGGWDWSVVRGYVLDHPISDGTRMLAADWLDEDDQSDRAEFIRVQCQMIQMLDVFGADALTSSNPEAAPLLTAERRLVESLRPSLTEELFAPDSAQHEIGTDGQVRITGEGISLTYVRGFVGKVAIPISLFLSHAAELFARQPIVAVRLTDKHPVAVAGGWWWANTCLAPTNRDCLASYIPPNLYANLLSPRSSFRRLPMTPRASDLTYATPDAALIALSSACVGYGRAAAGLRPLSQTMRGS